MNEMPYCPILNLVPEAADKWIQCEGERCAWYRKERGGGRCAVLTVADALEEIATKGGASL